MGCCASGDAAPEHVLPDPEGRCEFVVKSAGTFSKHYIAYTKGGEKWLLLRNESSFWDNDAEISLENYERSQGDDKGVELASVHIEGTDPEFKRKYDIDEDSDEDISDSDEEEETEFKVKLKWKLKKKATFKDKSGSVVGKLSFKMKGKTKAELTKTTNEETGEESESMETHSKVKKVFYNLTLDGQEQPLTYQNSKWDHGDRRWDCTRFGADYDEKSGKDALTIETKEGEPAVSLICGFTLGFFFHPKFLIQQMERSAESSARSLAFHHE